MTVAYPPDTDTPGLAEENKTKVHTFSTRYTLKSILPWFFYGSPLFLSFLASRDQINLRDFWGLSAGPSGQSDSSGCSGETRVPLNQLICEPWVWVIISLSDLQQGNFNSSVGPDGYMLSAVTCGMSPVTSITEGLQQVPASKWVGTNEFYFTIHGFRLLHTDRHHGIISHHRTVLPGEFWQHRAALHDSEGADESSRQAGIAAAAPMSSSAGAPPLPRYHHPAPQLVHNYRWGGRRRVFECISDVI